MIHDGRHVVAGALDRTVRVWDISTGLPLHTLKGHKYVPSHIAFCKDGRLVSGDAKGDLVLWDLRSGYAHLLSLSLP